jgi:hypothetical protein
VVGGITRWQLCQSLSGCLAQKRRPMSSADSNLSRQVRSSRARKQPAIVVKFVSRAEQLRIRSGRNFGRWMMKRGPHSSPDPLERCRLQAEQLEEQHRDRLWAERHGPIPVAGESSAPSRPGRHPADLTIQPGENLPDHFLEAVRDMPAVQQDVILVGRRRPQPREQGPLRGRRRPPEVITSVHHQDRLPDARGEVERIHLGQGPRAAEAATQ